MWIALVVVSGWKERGVGWLVLMLIFGYLCVFFFQAEDGIRDAQESRGLGDVYKRQQQHRVAQIGAPTVPPRLDVVTFTDRGPGVAAGEHLSLIHI